MQRIVLGDNQFFGINHMSEEKARSQSLRFQEISSVLNVIDVAYRAGVGGFMCTTHERISLVCDHIRANSGSYAGFEIYPGMPYAHKYANAVTDHGILGALKRFTPEDGYLSTAFRGGGAIVRNDIEGLITLLVDAEMKMFAGLNTPVVFLQNVVTDMLLGLKLNYAFRVFADHVRDRYGAEPGFITMNLPMALDSLEAVGVDNPIVCSNLNKAGFRMCGGLDSYEEALRDRKFRAVAMSIFASGAIDPREAIEWIATQPNIESIVFGASSQQSIMSTIELLAASGWNPK